MYIQLPEVYKHENFFVTLPLAWIAIIINDAIKQNESEVGQIKF